MTNKVSTGQLAQVSKSVGRSKPIILASQSKIRAAILVNAGLDLATEPAKIDEHSIKAAMLQDGAPPRDIADTLAEMKAQKVARKFPDQFVLGCDQILVFEGRIFDKPNSSADARRQLLQLRNNTHELLSAAVIFHGGAAVFRHIGRARLTVRNFSDSFLDTYLEQEGNGVMDTVGAYKIEARGAQLFSGIDGDYFSILGLPLLEILDYFRTRAVLVQ